MNKYSPIDKIIIKDFRAIEEMQIDFSESPIVTLVGDNDAGKTSALKAFEVCSLHYNARGQKGYVRNGAPFFGVVVQLSDGTTVIRMKTVDNINKYEVRYPDGTSWVTNKISEGLPVQVSEVLGMSQEPETGEYLQVRTYEDQLMFAYTPASTNYKVMYDALKVGQITRAVRNGTEEANRIRSQILSNYTSIRSLDESIRKIRVIDIDSAIDIRKSIKNLKENILKIRDALEIKESIEEKQEQLGTLRLIDSFKLQEVNEIRTKLINDAISIRESMSVVSDKLSSMHEVNSLEEVNSQLLDKIGRAVEEKEAITYMVNKLGKMEGIEEAEEVDSEIASRLSSALDTLQAYNNVHKSAERFNDIERCVTLDNEIRVIEQLKETINTAKSINDAREMLSKTTETINETSCILKEAGVRVETCPNCGTDIVISDAQ